MSLQFSQREKKNHIEMNEARARVKILFVTNAKLSKCFMATSRELIQCSFKKIIHFNETIKRSFTPEV